MTDDLKIYEKTIKKKYRLGWIPKYEEEIFVTLERKYFIPLVSKTFEQLGWDITFLDTEEGVAEAKRAGNDKRWTEKIVVTYDYKKMNVKSISLDSEICDFGNNSKRVKLFIHAFEQTQKELGKEGVSQAYNEFEEKMNWDDYQIPDSLPQPKKATKPNFRLLLAGGFCLALVVGYILAFFTHRADYLWGIFEVVTGFVFFFGFKYLIIYSNYLNFDKINPLLIGCLIFTYLSYNIFLYRLSLSDFHEYPVSLPGFIRERFSFGFIKGDWLILFPICIAIQTIVSWFLSYLLLSHSILEYAIKKVPLEVVDFACYHFVKGKDEEQVRKELARMGWTEEENQNEVFNAIGGFRQAAELNRT